MALARVFRADLSFCLEKDTATSEWSLRVKGLGSIQGVSFSFPGIAKRVLLSSTFTRSAPTG